MILGTDLIQRGDAIDILIKAYMKTGMRKEDRVAYIKAIIDVMRIPNFEHKIAMEEIADILGTSDEEREKMRKRIERIMDE